MDDTELRKFLIGILEQMKVQQEFLKILSISCEALVHVLSDVAPEFGDVYEKRVQDLKSGPAGQTHQIALHELAKMIRQLREGGELDFDLGKSN